MAETETKKIVVNPRVEIDTSPPFESVKEAVDHFGGSGPWIPHQLLRLPTSHHQNEVFDVDKMEEQTVQLERDLIIKHHETLDVLKQLEEAKRFVSSLKLDPMPQLNQAAKLNLNRASVDLAVIQSSLESLNKNLRHDKVSSETRTKKLPVQNTEGTIKQGNFEDEQFKKMTEASRYEVMKAIADIESTKKSIKMAEMRLNAAKKMEEAAKAFEAISLANKRDLFNNNSGEVTLSSQEYKALTQKAIQAEEICNTKFVDFEMPVLEKFEETAMENKESEKEALFKSKFRFRNSHSGVRGRDILDGNESSSILCRKLILEDDAMIEGRVEDPSEKQNVSLGQMLQEKSGVFLHPTITDPTSTSTSTSDKKVEKRYFIQRKKFGFIRVPIPTKLSKKKLRI